MNRMVRVIMWCVLALLSISMVGCNTMRGAGEDVENLGEGMQDVAS